jgi:hypothetical protein
VLNLEVAPLGVEVTVLEPGGMRTDWGGSSMAVPPVSEPYRATVGAFAGHIRANNEGAASDPAKVAQVLLQVADMENPPLRLLPGSDALAVADLLKKVRAESDDQLRELSESTDTTSGPRRTWPRSRTCSSRSPRPTEHRDQRPRGRPAPRAAPPSGRRPCRPPAHRRRRPYPARYTRLPRPAARQ